MNNIESIFTKIYDEDLWSMGQKDSKSGLGSSFLYTKNIKNIILDINKKNTIKTMIDTSCGDWFWMKDIAPELNCIYTGLDVVKNIIDINKIKYTNSNIQFVHIDFLSYLKLLPNNSVDLILCRHTCEHLPTEYILDFINEAKRVSKYLLLTTHKNAKANISLIETITPYRPININLEPYSLILNKYQIDSFYDGPTDKYCSEMYINLYAFI